MDTTRSNVNRTTNSRSSYLPNITTSQTISYSQRYQHMTKIANYNEMNQAQIWKEYEKLRICLKELNEEVLHHMEKKATLNLYTKQAPPPPSVQAALLLIEQERKTTESRMQIFQNEAAILQQRVQHLTNKTEYLQDINNEIELGQAKIKEMILENKDLKRKEKLIAKDLLLGPSFLEKLVIEEEALHYARKKYDKYEQVYKQAIAKTKQFNEKTAEFQSVLQNRVHQYKQQEGYIVEEVNLQKFQQLQAQKANLAKYQTVYKRNYLMKLKQLETIVNSITKHDQIITDTENNIRSMRGQIDQISALVAMNNNRRRSSISVMQSQANQIKTGRRSILLDNSMAVKDNASKDKDKDKDKSITSANDKNRPTIKN